MDKKIKERGIIFNGEMVRAILDGRKTQTRRVVKLQPESNQHGMCVVTESGIKSEEGKFFWSEFNATGHKSRSPLFNCPFGKVGDRLIPCMKIPSLDDRYCADVYGNIWSNQKGKWIKLSGASNGKGYLTVTPAKDGKYKTRTIHDLVAEAFFGAKPAGMQVRHLDGNQLNNAPENMDYGTQEQNWGDRLVHGKSLGESHHSSKLSLATVTSIRNSSQSLRCLARIYGVSPSTIWNVKHSNTWNDSPVAPESSAPRWVSRMTLEITYIRVERLRSISEGDAVKEGVPPAGDLLPNCPDTYLTPKGDLATAKVAFQRFWESIYGQDSWQSNPFVWVVEFKRVCQ